MAYKGNVLITLIFLYGMYVNTDAVRCYDCKSKDLPDKCGDTFRLNASDVNYIVDNCDNCLKTVYKDSKLIVRNCTKSDSRSISYRSGCHKEKESGVEVNTCACTKDLCNSSGKHFSSTYWLFISFVHVMFTVSSCLVLHE